MSEVAERYSTVAEGFTVRLDGVAPQSWSVVTPCPDWSVRDLVVHVTTTHRRVISTVNGIEPDAVEPGVDPVPQWSAATGAVRVALGDESLSSKIMSGMFGEQTFESLVGRLVCSDTLIHTWDLGRATGQDETLDPDAVAKALEALTPMDEAIRRPGGFGTKIAPAPDADLQTRFLNFCGRAP
jgi:uncharacterized protein (TIGR03086 family)